MIKKLLVICIFIIFSATFVGKGQNLVPNGDFEGYSICPFDFSQIHFALSWTQPLTQSFNSSDYYNQCNTTGFVGVPNNGLGYQSANSGVAFAGICLFYCDSGFNIVNYREYIEVTLTSPLIANSCYNFQMYISLCDASNYTTDDISVYLSDTLISGITNHLPLAFIPQINNAAGNYPDTLNWTLVSGNYVANGGENYLLIGNFKNDNNTDTININTSTVLKLAYVYIDDVSLTPCATGINENNPQTEITIYPNPAGEEITVSSKQFGVSSKKKEINIYDMMGKEVLKTQYSILNSQINISSLKQGMYFIEINGVRKKFVKQNF